MMDNKKTEKYIEQALNSEKPDRKVLNAAKNIMAEKQRRSIKRSWRYYVAAASSACLFIFGIIAAILSRQDLVANESNAVLGQTHTIKPADIWLIISIVSISIAVIIGVVIIIKVKKAVLNKGDGSNEK